MHHAAIRNWFSRNSKTGLGHLPDHRERLSRVSSNPKVLPSPIGVETARSVLLALRATDGHHFVTDDVSITDADVPRMLGHRQITDAHLLTLARRRGFRLLTFDTALVKLAQNQDVELLSL
jgi:toxin-antitoxin system PIN domain toxin